MTKPVTIKTVKEHIKVLDEINGTDYYNSIDWDNPKTELPDFLKQEKE